MSRYPLYLNLSKGAATRLESLRTIAQRGGVSDWRQLRAFGFHNGPAAYGLGMNPGFNGEGRHRVRVWYSHTGEYFRTERYADEVEAARINHKGWYCDPDSQETSRGIVATLPHGRFLAGYWLSMNGERVWFDDVYDSERDAARMADEHARVIGENEMEYQTRWQAARDLEDQIEASLKRLRECFVLRHHECMAYVRAEVSQLIRAIRKARETLATDYKGVLV